MVKADTAAMSPFFDGTLIELGAGGADVTVKKDGTCFFVDTLLYGGVSERTGDHLSFVTEVEVGEPYRDLWFFSGGQARISSTSCPAAC